MCLSKIIGGAVAAGLICVGAFAAEPSGLGTQAAAVQNDIGDLVLLYRKSSKLSRFTTTIDGVKRFESVDELVNSGYTQCLVIQGSTYAALGDDKMIASVLNGEIARTLGAMAGSRPLRAFPRECVRGGQVINAAVDVIAVQRQTLPALSAQPEFADFLPLTEISYQALANRANERRQALAKRAQAVAAWTAEIDALAQSASTDKIGSLSLSLPRDGDKTINVCTLDYAGAVGQAVLTYAERALSYASEGFRARAAASQSMTQSLGRPVTTTFSSLDAFYAEQQKDVRKCQLFVDVPKNLRLLMTAIERDRKAPAYEVNELVSTLELREAWAKKRGYPDLAASELASALQIGVATIKKLADKGVRDKAGFDAVVKEMRAVHYSDNGTVDEVMAYLDDKDAAAATGKRGVTAVTVRDARQKAEKLEAERRAAEERKRQADYAREFPYTATISCGFNGRHINLVACLQGDYTKSQLELTNGTAYRMYQPWEVSQVGRETRDGMVIPLRARFKLTIGNDSDQLLLTVKIVENASGKTVYTKSASKFGSIRISN